MSLQRQSPVAKQRLTPVPRCRWGWRSQCPHSAATFLVENITDLAVTPLEINMASSPSRTAGPIASLAGKILNKVGRQKKEGTDSADPESSEGRGNEEERRETRGGWRWEGRGGGRMEETWDVTCWLMLLRLYTWRQRKTGKAAYLNHTYNRKYLQ